MQTVLSGCVDVADARVAQGGLLFTPARLALMHLALALVLGVIGVAAAMVLRLELLTPALDVLQARNYGAFLSLHGFLLFYFVAWPLLPASAGNYLLATRSPSGRLAFPRLAELALHLLGLGATLVLGGFILGGTEIGWRFDAMFGGRFDHPGLLPASVGVLLCALAMAATGLNTVATAAGCLRRRPAAGAVFSLSALMSGALALIAAAFLAVAMVLVLADRLAGLSLFVPAAGGDPQLFTRLFAFLLAPAKASMLLLGCGVVYHVLEQRAPGGAARQSAMFGLAVLAISGALAWGGMKGLAGGFSVVGFGVVLAASVRQMAASDRGLDAALVYAMGFLVTVLQALVTGWMADLPSAMNPLSNSLFVAASDHLMWLALLGMAVPAFLHQNWARLTGRGFAPGWAMFSALVVVTSVQLAFAPMLVMGLRGASFRANAYPADLQVWQVLATAGSTVLIAGLAAAALNLLASRRAEGSVRAPA